MKQFNLEEYLRLKEEGKEPKIVTRDGDPVRILCTDRDGLNTKPIVALCKIYNGTEVVHTYWENGSHTNGRDEVLDLFFAPTKHEGWMNIYPLIGFKDAKSIGGDIYTTEQKALEMKSSNCVATVKVEWED